MRRNYPVVTLILMMMALVFPLNEQVYAVDSDPVLIQNNAEYNGTTIFASVGQTMPELPFAVEVTVWNEETQSYDTRQTFPANYHPYGECPYIGVGGPCGLYCIGTSEKTGAWNCGYGGPNVGGLVGCPGDVTSITVDSFGLTCYGICVISCGNCPVYQWIPSGWAFFCVWGVPEWMLGLIPMIASPDESGDPVNVIYGNMRTFRQNDFELSGRNEPLVFYKTYHSQSQYDGPLGYGWTHSYNVTLTRLGLGQYEVMDADGRLHFFIDNSYPSSESGYYSPAIPDGSRLESVYQQAHIWVREDGTKFYFPWLYYSVLMFRTT